MASLVRKVFVVLGAALNVLSNGSVHGFPAVLLEQLQKSGEIPFDKHQSSTFASILGFTGLAGSLIAPVLMNRFGRRPAHICSTLPITLGWILTAFAPNIAVLTAARLLHGLGLGLRSPIACILVAEYSDPKNRGAFLGSFAISLSLGVLTSHLIGSFLTWRVTALVLTVLPLLSMTIMIFSPESPSWLAAKGRFVQCEESFLWLRGYDYKNKLELEKLILSQSSRSKRNDGIKFWEALRYRYFLLPTSLAFSLEVMCEFGGGHVMPAYINVILTSILEKANVSLEIAVIDGVRVVTAIVAVFFVQRFKRKTILLYGTVTTVLSLLSISIYSYLTKYSYASEWRMLAMCFFVVYTISFSLCIVPLVHISLGEIFPLKVRSLGATCSTITLTPSYMISLKTAPYLFNFIGVEGAFIIYGGILTVCVSFLMFLLPEMKDKTLQEIESHFDSSLNENKEVELKLIKSIESR